MESRLFKNRLDAGRLFADFLLCRFLGLLDPHLPFIELEALGRVIDKTIVLLRDGVDFCVSFIKQQINGTGSVLFAKVLF